MHHSLPLQRITFFLAFLTCILFLKSLTAVEESTSSLIADDLTKTEKYAETVRLSQQILGDDTPLEKIISAEENKGIIFTLEDCIYIALRDSEGVENAYLNRIVQQLNLESAENAYLPSGTFNFGASRTDSDTRSGGSHERGYSVTGPDISLSKKIKTGGRFDFNWKNGLSMSDNGRVSDATANWDLSFSQPLLRGSGLEIGSIDLTRAYLGEKRNRLNLKTTLISKVNSVIFKYRSYIQTIIGFAIEEKAIERARETFKQTKLLVELGREAKSKLLDQEIFLADREIAWETTKNDKDEARIDLLRELNISTDIALVPDRLDYFEIPDDDLPTLEEAIHMAALHDENYQGSLISLREAELDFLQAKDDQLWDLNLTAGINNARNGSSKGASSFASANKEAFKKDGVAWNVGLSFSADIPINNNSRIQPWVSARIAIRQARISMRTAREELVRNLKNQLRSLKTTRKQVELEKARLANKELQIAKSKLEYEAGKITSFEYNGLETERIDAQTSLLSRKITYLNTLTSFDDALGTTLDTWQIELNNRLAKKPEILKDYYQKQLKDKLNP